MPAVPYSPVPEVPISQQGIQGVNVPTPIAAFGGTIAEAIGSSGKALERAGDEIMQRAVAIKQLENETEAREADAEYTVAMGELRAKYHSLEGRNAVSAFPQYQQDVRKLQQDFSSRMSNPMSKRIFDRESRGMMARSIFSGAGHSATQNRLWAERASVARTDTTISSTLQDGSPTAIVQARRTIEDESHNLAGLNGWDEASRERWAREQNSKLITTQVRRLANDDPFEAKRFLDENRAQLDDKDILRAEQTVQTSLYRKGSLKIANEINDQPIEGGDTLERRVERAKEKAQQLVPDDKEFAQFAADQVITGYNRQRGLRQEVTNERRNVIESALIGGLGDGKIPASLDELRSLSPEAATAWDSLKPADQRKYMGIMAKLSKGDVAWTPERLREMEKLKGLAHTDPAAFMSRDLAGEDLPLSARKQLLDLRVALAKRSGGDPRLSSALQMLRPMLRSAGIMSDQDKDRYNQFVGGLLDSLADWQKANPGKVPKKEDYEKMGTNLLSNQRDPTKYTVFGLFPNRQTPLFEQSLPEALLEEFKNDPRWQGREPTAVELEQFRRQYIRKRYQELFGGAASGGGAATPVQTQSYPQVPMSK